MCSVSVAIVNQLFAYKFWTPTGNIHVRFWPLETTGLYVWLKRLHQMHVSSDQQGEDDEKGCTRYTQSI